MSSNVLPTCAARSVKNAFRENRPMLKIHEGTEPKTDIHVYSFEIPSLRYSEHSGRDPILSTSTQRNAIFLKNLSRKLSGIWNQFPRCALLFVTILIEFIKENG